MPFTKANGHSFAVAGAVASIQARKLRPPRAGVRKQIYDLKVVAHRDATSDETPVGVKASLMRAYVDLHEIEMAITGQGKPKPVEARNASPKRKARPTVSPVRVSTSNTPLSFAKDIAPVQPISTPEDNGPR